MYLLIFALLCAFSHAQTYHVHDVIVIGAGTSGISASKVLNQHQIDHIILQGRDRIGGRIFSSDLDGQQIDLGATFVHNPGVQNPIYNLIKELNRPIIPANGNKVQQFDLNRYSLNKTEKEDFANGVKELQKFIFEWTKERDTNLQTAWQFFSSKNGYKYSKEVLTRLLFKLTMQGSVNGADLNKVSARQYVRNTQSNAQDIIPVGGYESLLKALYQRCCKKTKIYFNHFVTSIDYSGDVIKVTTKNRRQFYCKKIIVSVPLGVLKKGVISFIPRLPSAYRSAISSIGFGVFNKVIVTFKDFFWKQDRKILNFVANKDKHNKYEQCYVVTATPKVNLVMFLVAGSKSVQVSKMKNSEIAQDLAHSLQQFVSYPVKVKNITVTRWEQDQYSYGSYSYYKVGTRRQHFQTLKTPIGKKFWLIGEHTHPKFSSNVHGAYDSGRLAALEVIKSLSQAKSNNKRNREYERAFKIRQQFKQLKKKKYE